MALGKWRVPADLQEAEHTWAPGWRSKEDKDWISSEERGILVVISLRRVCKEEKGWKCKGVARSLFQQAINKEPVMSPVESCHWCSLALLSLPVFLCLLLPRLVKWLPRGFGQTAFWSPIPRLLCLRLSVLTAVLDGRMCVHAGFTRPTGGERRRSYD